MRVFLLTFLSILAFIYCQDASNLKQTNADQFISEKMKDEDKIKKLLDSIFSVEHEKGRNDTAIASGDKNPISNVQIQDVFAVPEGQEDNNTTISENEKEDQDEFDDELLDSIFSIIPEKGRNDSTLTSGDEHKDIFSVPEKREENNSTTPDQDEIYKFLDSIFSDVHEEGRNDSTITPEAEAKNQTSNVQIKDVFAIPEIREDNNTKTIKNNENEEQRLEILIKSIFTVGEVQENNKDVSVKLDQDQKQKVLPTTNSGIFVFPGEEHLYYKRIKSRMNEITSSSEKVHSDIIFPED